METVRHWYLIEALARIAMRSGDKAASGAVGALANALLTEGLREGLDPAFRFGLKRIEGDPQKIDAVFCARQLLGLLDQARDGEMVKDHPVHVLYRTGGITLAELRASQEIRWAAEVCSSARLRAIDPGKLSVDGGKTGPFGPLLGLDVSEHAALERVRDWARHEMGRDDGLICGSKASVTTLEVVGEVVVKGGGMRALDKVIGVRNGTSADRVKAALRRFTRTLGPGIAS